MELIPMYEIDSVNSIDELMEQDRCVFKENPSHKKFLRKRTKFDLPMVPDEEGDLVLVVFEMDGVRARYLIKSNTLLVQGVN